MSTVRHYLGIDFEVWDGDQRWMWCVTCPYREAGAVGIAASENDAVRDACISIDEMLMLPPQVPMRVEWEIALSNLEQYLAECCDRMA